jgi:hypothetical protein
LTFKPKETVKSFQLSLSLYEPGYQAEFPVFRADGVSHFFLKILNFARKAVL